MEYTHNWYRPQTIAASTFDAISEDFQKVLPALEAGGSPIANAYGLEQPEFTTEYLRINGVRHCGHTLNLQIRLAGPARDGCGIGDSQGMGSVLPYRTCNGDCSYESVWFDRCIDEENRDENGICGAFWKTAFRPTICRDSVSASCKAPSWNALRIHTDGEAKQWEDALQLCHAKLGCCMTFEEVIG